MNTFKILLIAFLFAGRPLYAQTDKILILKPGDEAATQELAGEYLSKMAAFIGENVKFFKGKAPECRIFNRLQEAEDFLRDEKPVIVFSPPGFYLKNLKKASAKPVAQVPRFGQNVERFYIVTSKNNGSTSLEALKNKTIRTTFSFDLPYLQRVVFPQEQKPGEFFKLEASENLADDVFFLLEGDDDAAAGLLLDEELKRFFESDELVWPALQIAWTSEPAPRDLIVTIGERWTEALTDDLLAAMKKMPEDQDGKEILDLMHSSGFVKVDSTLLNNAAAKYSGNNE